MNSYFSYTLLDLFKKYQNNLEKRVFIVDASGVTPIFSFQFFDDSFCHLLGIQHLLKGRVNRKNFSGLSGAVNIETGVLTFDLLDSFDHRGLGKLARRINSIDYLCNGFFQANDLKLYFFDKGKADPPSIINATYAFRSSSGVSIYFLGIEKTGALFTPNSIFPCGANFLQNEIEIKPFTINITSED
jgi:hypothetical protein